MLKDGTALKDGAALKDGTALKDGAVLKDGTKAVVGMFRNATGGKVSKEELVHVVARAKF